MGGKSSTPCSSEGDAFCKTVAEGKACENSGGTFWCSCNTGFRAQGTGRSSTCIDIDECAQGLDDCKAKGADCVNTPGSYTCGCGPYREDKGNGKCVDINECAVDRGNCDEHSDCVNQDGAEQLCKCQKGWTGNNDKPGVACRDVNECYENPSICPANAICTNLPGSYKCECGPGFEPDSSGSGCVTEDFCGTGKNDCDRSFASCSLVPGSFKCECLHGFRGAGTVNTCEPLAGNEELACSTLGLICGNYKECTKSLTEPGVWECKNKASSEQIAVFLTQGATNDTPTWVWAVVALSSIILLLISGGIIWCVYKRFRKPDDSEDELLDDGEFGAGYSYGATQGFYA